MKKILISFLLFNAFLTGYAQQPYYDAIKLNNYIDKTTGQFFLDSITLVRVAEILEPYLNNQSKTKLTANQVFAKLNTTQSPEYNPFIDTLINTSGLQGVGFTSSILGQSKFNFSSIGGLDVTNIADGLAKFMVERAKQELNTYFFETFRDKLKQIVELQVMFPQTAMLLDAIGTKVYNYNAYLIALREAFEEDLACLFVNFPKLLEEERYKKIFKDKELSQLRIILKSSFHVISQLNNNIHPGDILHSLTEPLGIDTLPQNVYSSIRIADIFSQSIRSKQRDKYWVSTDSLGLLINPNVFRIYLGLIYQQTPNTIIFKVKKNDNVTSINFKHVLKSLGENWDDGQNKYKMYEEFVSGLGGKVDNVMITLKGVRSKASGKTTSYNDMYSFLNASLDLIEYAENIYDLPYLKDVLKKQGLVEYRKYLSVARNASNLYLNINERNYGTAIFNLASIIDTIYANPKVVAKVKMSYAIEIKKMEDSISPDKNLKKKEIKVLKKKMEMVDQFKELVLKYGSFMAAVVNAQNSDEVKSIIESVALPAGSSRIKRESQFNISVNSYLGAFIGHEYIKGVKNNLVINNYALSAPVGISFSWGGLRCKKGKAGWSVGGFFSLIDIGALASYRLGDDSTTTVSNVKLEQILAPGLFFSIGFPKTPFSFSVGAQIGPLLREVAPDQNTYGQNGYWRFGATIAVDIPLFNLHNREKRTK